MFLQFNEMLSDLLAQKVIGSNVELELMFLLRAQSMCFILCSCVLPHIPSDDMARIFPELLCRNRESNLRQSAQLHLFEGP